MSQTEEKREGFYLSEDGEWIPDGWVEFTLVDLVVLQRGFDLPAKNRVVGGFPLITASGQDGTHNEGKVKAPGVVTGRSGTIGQVFLINNDFWPLNTTLWVKDFKGNDVIFCYYFLKRFPFSRFNSGSGVPTLNRNHIHPHSIAKPPLPEQKAIASVLGSLDDKIELLREQNETLEALAQTLFKRWFIDFNFPDENGNPYKDSGGTMIPSELGEIPEGWSITDVRNILSRSKSPRNYTKEELTPKGEIPVYEQGQSILLGFHDNPPCFEANIESPMFIFGDHTCITKLIVTPFSLSSNVIPFKGKDLDTVWTYFAIHKLQKFIEYRRHWMELADKKLVTPHDGLDSKYSQLVSPLIEKLSLKEIQIQTLTHLRDTLLPKLMKGEIRIKNL